MTTTEPAPPQSASPALADGLAAAVTQVYADAEATILFTVTGHVRSALKAADPTAALLARSAANQNAARRTVDRLESRARAAVRTALATAYGRGHGQQGTVAARAEQDALGRLAPLRQAIMRWVAALWNRLVSAMTAPDPKLAAGRVMQQAAKTGVTAYDGRGQRSVVSHATETAQHAAGGAVIDGFLDRLTADGGDLVIVTESPHPCSICRPWEHRVLSVSGTDPKRPSVAGARAAGLWHPRCRHVLFRWFPGFTWPDNALQHRPGRYEDTQRQRDIERQIRAWKRREAAALDETTRLAAARKVRAWQAELRRFLAQTGLTRSRQRERGDYGHSSPLKHALG